MFFVEFLLLLTGAAHPIFTVTGAFLYSGDNFRERKIVVDISKVFPHPTKEDTSKLKDLLQTNHTDHEGTIVTFYYETDLNDKAIKKVDEISNFLSALTSHGNNDSNNLPNIILSLRYNTFEWGEIETPPGSGKYETHIFPENIYTVFQKLECRWLKWKLAFEYIGDNHSCKNESYYGTSHDVITIATLKALKSCNNPIQLGHTISHTHFQCQHLEEKTLDIDFLVIKVNFELYNNFVESYGAFKRYLDLVIEQTGNNEYFVYYQLQYTDNNDLIFEDDGYHDDITLDAVKRGIEHQRQRSTENMAVEKYQCLFHTFVHEWLLSGESFVIFNALEYSETCLTLENSPLKSLMTPDITKLFDSYRISCNMSWHSLQMNINNLLQGEPQSVILRIVPWINLQKYTNSYSKECEKVFESNPIAHQSNFSLLNANIFFNSIRIGKILDLFQKRPNYNIKQQVMFSSEMPIVGIKAQTITIDLDFPAYGNILRLDNLIALRNKTRFSCIKRLKLIEVKVLNQSEYKNFYNIVSSQLASYFWHASDTLELCDDLILAVECDLDTSIFWQAPYRDNLLKTIKSRFYMIQGMIQTRWRTKKVILSLERIGLNYVIPVNEKRDTLYCNPTAGNLSEYFESIFTWADIYKVPLIVNNFADQSHKSPVGWVKLIADDKVLPRIQETFPLFLRRSYNQSRVLGYHINGTTHQCLEWIDQVPMAEIEFGRSQIGTCLQLHLRPYKKKKLTENEITILLLFTMKTFQMTEIKVVTYNDIESVFETLTNPDFRQVLQANSIPRREIFLSVPIMTFKNQSNLLELLHAGMRNVSLFNDSFVLKFHFAYAATKEYTELSTLTENISSAVGLELNNCVDIVMRLGSDHVKPRNLTTVDKMIKKLSHVVCTIPRRNKLATSRLEMQKFFETHIYIKMILQTFFPNLKNVYFKMPYGKTTTSTLIDELLILLSQMTNFSKYYNIPYFIMPAFAPVSSSEQSWWKIANYTDLSSTVAFRDIHSEYLKRQPVDQWMPILTQKVNIVTFDDGLVPSTTTVATIIVVPEAATVPTMDWFSFGLATIIVLLVSILIGVAKKARRYNKTLTSEEVQEFIKGGEVSKLTSGPTNDYNNSSFENGEYKKQYEISKREISVDLNNILGVGNFGIVYNATMKSNLQPVAVKMPRIGYDKQSFIGMLREVKLLGYLGKHENVVGFIGSYTKEIQNGVLYVVMELCSGGSLLAHLRNIKAKRKDVAQEDVIVDLIRFCHEIARGMEYISRMNIVHGDLSARNVLLDSLNVCKISDFGLSRKLYEYRIYSKKTNEPLPWRWMSYESLANMEFSVMSDVWSFGVTAWEVFSLGSIPYPGVFWISDFVKELENGMRLTVPLYATSKIHNTISECWKIDADQRPRFSELVKFFSDLPYIQLEI